MHARCHSRYTVNLISNTSIRAAGHLEGSVKPCAEPIEASIEVWRWCTLAEETESTVQAVHEEAKLRARQKLEAY